MQIILMRPMRIARLTREGFEDATPGNFNARVCATMRSRARVAAAPPRSQYKSLILYRVRSLATGHQVMCHRCLRG